MLLKIFIMTLLWKLWSAEITMPDVSPKSVSEINLKANYVANSINNFGYKLTLQMMHGRENDNIIISPTGIAGLLAMTLLGAVGKTYYEIAENLGFSQDILENRKNHENFGELLKYLNSMGSSKTLYADAIFVDEKTRIRQVYRNYLNYVYNGQVLSANFTEIEETKILINEWVKDHTEGKIDEFLKQPLPAFARVVLLSALYFSGQWEQPFKPEYTAKMTFKTKTHEVMADLMLNYGLFNYIYSENEGLHMIALPYNDSVTTMYALKPNFPQQVGLSELMERLNYNKIEVLINQMTKKKCVVRFPKMDVAGSTNLEEPLKALGIQSMFLPGVANFPFMLEDSIVINKTEDEIIARIKSTDNKDPERLKDLVNSLPNPGIHVDSILHDVKMNINEYGTEAVAATGAILARSAEQFYADSPFYIFLRNERTKLVTFSAVINDPTI